MGAQFSRSFGLTVQADDNKPRLSKGEVNRLFGDIQAVNTVLPSERNREFELLDKNIIGDIEKAFVRCGKECDPNFKSYTVDEKGLHRCGNLCFSPMAEYITYRNKVEAEWQAELSDIYWGCLNKHKKRDHDKILQPRPFYSRVTLLKSIDFFNCYANNYREHLKKINGDVEQKLKEQLKEVKFVEEGKSDLQETETE